MQPPSVAGLSAAVDDSNVGRFAASAIRRDWRRKGLGSPFSARRCAATRTVLSSAWPTRSCLHRIPSARR